VDEDKRLSDVKEITLSYTFFEVENPTDPISNTSQEADATLRRDAVN